MSNERYYWVYILASKLGGTLYIGVTNNLIRRMHEHRMGLVPGFTKRYRIHRLVYFEPHTDIETAIGREKRLKSWNRAWKVRLIEELNPNWDDLYPKIASLDVTALCPPALSLSAKADHPVSTIAFGEYWMARLRGP